MDEIQKIDLGIGNPDPQVANQQVGQKTRKSFSFPKKASFIFLVIILLSILAGIGIGLPAIGVYKEARATYTQGKSAWDALKKQDIEKTSEELSKTQASMKKTRAALRGLSYTKFIPLIGGYYNDSYHLINAGDAFLEAAQVSVDAIKPYADVLGLKGQGSFVSGSAEDRIQKTVQAMDKITPKLPDIHVRLKKAGDEVSQINPNHYPSIFGLQKVHTQLVTLKEITEGVENTFDQAEPLLHVLPSLLGEPSEKKYLVIFQNDKELRPTGGFITAYAIFRLERGRATAESADDIYTLDERRVKKVPAPDLIKKYLPGIGGGATTTWEMRDANLSPDFKISMMQVNDFYNQVPGRSKIDGIISVDTQFLVEVVKILDGVETYGTKYTAGEDKRCNCPNIVYELSDAITRPVGYVRSGRKDVIGVLLSAIMQKALSSSPKLYWGPLFQSGITALQEKHILIYLFNEDAQKGLESLNAAGRIKDFDGDYLHISDANFAGAKSNMYVRESVVQDIKSESNGSIVKTVTIDYKNPQPASDCNLEQGGLCLNGILRNVLRIYVPKGSELLENQGFEKGPETKEDLGKTVFEGFMTVKPQGKASVTIKYRVPSVMKKGNSLPMLIQKQPGTEGNEYIIKVNGRETQKFNLREDKELILTL